MKKNNPRYINANLRMLEFIARKLGALNDEVVYLGGCTTALFISDPLSLDVRPTQDVDCIVDIVSLSEYYQFCEKLTKQGFKQSMHEQVICRWYHEDGDAILDVMPTDKDILNFGNRWYKEAIQNSITHKLSDDITIKSVTVPYLLATKIEAFKSRGNNDFLGSHDFEDIITMVAGRIEVADEIALENVLLKSYLKTFFEEIMQDSDFHAALPGHVYEGPITSQRIQTINERIKNIITY